MNKTLLYLTTALLCLLCYSCSSDEDNIDVDNGAKETLLSPPTWIIGTWQSQTETSSSFKAEFTKSNLIFTIITLGVEQTRDLMEESKNSVVPVTLNELVKTETEYHVSITRGAGSSTSRTNIYKFKKKSNDEIVYTLLGMEEADPVLIKK